jgi:hypothetical protein
VKTAGMFIELNQGFHPDPTLSIRDHVASDPLPDADRVVAYLQAGHPLIDMMDIQDDPLEPSRQLLGGSSILTDGEWLWRTDFAQLVRRHRVEVPEEFLKVIRARHYIVPEQPYEVLAAAAAEADKYAFGLGGGVPSP